MENSWVAPGEHIVTSVNLSECKADPADYVVDECWLKSHADDLFYELEKLAKKKHLSELIVTWQGDNSQPISGRYRVGDNYLTAKECAIVFKYTSVEDALAGKGVLLAFTTDAFELGISWSLEKLIAFAGQHGATAFNVFGMPLPGSAGTVFGHYDGNNWTLTRLTKGGQVYACDAEELA